jgi:hypothetical protein
MPSTAIAPVLENESANPTHILRDSECSDQRNTDCHHRSSTRRQSHCPSQQDFLLRMNLLRNPTTATCHLKTENRKPKTENRKPKTENRKPKTENRKLKTENRKPKTFSAFFRVLPW